MVEYAERLACGAVYTNESLVYDCLYVGAKNNQITHRLVKNLHTLQLELPRTGSKPSIATKASDAVLQESADRQL